MAEKTTLNRFPLFGLFAYRAVLRMRHSDTTARLLGYSTALLYAIFEAKAQSQKASIDKETKKELPKEVKRAKTGTVEFGGKEFVTVCDDANRLSKTVVGHEVQTPDKYDRQVREKFPEGWHDQLAEAFDRYLARYQPKELNTGNTLFELYKAWRDECKVGFNRVDLDQLLKRLRERE